MRDDGLADVDDRLDAGFHIAQTRVATRTAALRAAMTGAQARAAVDNGNTPRRPGRWPNTPHLALAMVEESAPAALAGLRTEAAADQAAIATLEAPLTPPVAPARDTRETDRHNGTVPADAAARRRRRREATMAKVRRRTWFTADQHFGHAGLLEKGVRKFTSVEAMDRALAEAWNGTVAPGDVVWHLGDLTLAGAAEATALLGRLHGTKHLVWGNHDRKSVRRLTDWASSQYGTEINLDGHALTLCHYAMRSWNGMRRGSTMLHGHSHGTMPGRGRCVDVGADCWDLRPILLEAALDRASRQPADAEPTNREDATTHQADLTRTTTHGKAYAPGNRHDGTEKDKKRDGE